MRSVRTCLLLALCTSTLALASPRPGDRRSQVTGAAPTGDEPIAAVPAAYQLTARDGRRTASYRAPSFCASGFANYPARDLELDDLEELLALERAYPAGKVDVYELSRQIQADANAIARLACTFGDRPEAQAWLATYEQHVVNHLGLTAPEWDGVLAYGLTHPKADWEQEGTAAAEAGCGLWTPDELGNRDDEDLKQARVNLVCTSRLRMEFYWPRQAWWMDRRPGVPSELDRAALLNRFVGQGPGFIGTDPELLKADAPKLALWVFARHDALAFDVDRALGELASLGVPAYGKVNGVLRLRALDAQIDATAAAYDAIAGRLPELGQAFTAAEQAFTSWETVYDAQQAVFDDAYAIESAWLSGRKANLAGCTDRLLGRFGAYARASGPKTAEEVEGLASQPVGYMLLSALYRCELELGNEHNAGAIGTLLAASAKQRGPRTAAVVAALGVVAKAKADFDRFPYEAERMVPWGSGPQDMGALGDQNEVDWAGQSGRNYQAYAAAVVKSVTPVGDRVKVEYRTERFQVPTYNCVLTDKISRITSDGRVLYRQNCTKTGMEWKESTEAPITLDAAVATGITAGAFVRARRENDLGYPMEVYSDASKANLVAYFGVPLK